MTWFYLALLAPLLFAIVSLIDDNLLQHVYGSAHVAAIISGCFALIPVTLLFIFGPDLSLPINLLLLSVAGGTLMSLAYYLYFRGLEEENPSVVAALFAITPALIPFAAYFIVGERLSLQAAIGFTILIVAAFAYSLTDVKKFKISKALLPVVVSSLIFDVVAVSNKYIYDRVDFYVSYFYFYIGLLIGGLIFLLVFKLKNSNTSIRQTYNKISIKIILLLALVEIIALTAGFAADRALSLGSVSLVKALENLQPVYTLLIALALFPFFPRYFREAESGQRKIKFALLLVMVLGAYVAVR